MKQAGLVLVLVAATLSVFALGYLIGARHAVAASAASVATVNAHTDTSAPPQQIPPTTRPAAHKRFPHAGACDLQISLSAQGYIPTKAEKDACRMEIAERAREAAQ